MGGGRRQRDIDRNRDRDRNKDTNRQTEKGGGGVEAFVFLLFTRFFVKV